MPTILRADLSTATDVKFTETDMIVELIDGRTITVPISWFPKLSHASRDSLSRWELLGEGEGIHWPDLDEDINVQRLLSGIPNR